jgi:hypothetical protein
MNVKDTFLELTSQTYPHGSESNLDGLLIDGLEFDEFGNRFIKIGDSTCMFTSHLDTATSANTKVNHVIEGNIIKTDGKSILGADDKAGVTIMFMMIENKIPGLYYFFLGEEVGCVGSKKVSEKLRNLKTEYLLESDDVFGKINKVISFDRRGTTNVITYQASSRCSSDDFAQSLADQLNLNETTFKYTPDPTGIYTDSAQFTKIYPECTNISVGYRSEHTFVEQQDIDHLEKLANACLGVKWEELVVKRDPSVVEYKSYGYGSYGTSTYGYWDNEWDEYEYYPRRQNLLSNASSAGSYSGASEEKIHFLDDEYNYVSTIERNKYTFKLKSIDFAPERILGELSPIVDLLNDLEVDYEEDGISWDGLKLTVKHKAPACHVTECNREELSEFLPGLSFWKKLSEDDYKGPQKVDFNTY